MICLEGKSITPKYLFSLQKCVSDVGFHGSSHEGHHGVRLASWRWSEYGIYVILCVTIILGPQS